MQVEDFAFTGQEVVGDVETLHGLEVQLQNGRGNQVGQTSGWIVSFFEFVQRAKPELLVLGILLVPLRDPCIQIPAVVIEPRLLNERLHVLVGLVFKLLKANNNVGNLYAGIVDVVLYINRVSSFAQQANEGIAQNRIAQMPDMRSLVGIDAGVFD